MSWKDIIKVDLREARTLGRKHATEEMSEGKLKIIVEKDMASGILGLSASSLYNLRRGYYTLLSISENVRHHSNLPTNLLVGLKIHDVKVEPQKNRDRGDATYPVLNPKHSFDDPFPEEDAIITIEYSVGSINNEKFSFALPPLDKKYSSRLRRPKTKRVKGGHRQRNPNQHIAFDREEDVA